MADATGAAPARSCSTGRQTCCCYSRPKLAEDGGHAPQAVAGPICFRNSPGALVRFVFPEMAAPDGFAPSSADSESAVLLLDDRAG